MDSEAPQSVVIMTLRQGIPIPMGVRSYLFASLYGSLLHLVDDLGTHQPPPQYDLLQKDTYEVPHRVVPHTISSHSMSVMVKMSNMTPRSTAIIKIVGGKGALDSEGVFGHGEQEVVES